MLITLQLSNTAIIYDTDCMTSRLFREIFNCRYNPRMDYAFCLLTLKSFEKWRSPLFGATCNFQGRIQDFKLGGALKKNCAERRETRKLLGYFVWKITILRQKILFFSNFRGGARRVLPPGSAPDFNGQILPYGILFLTFINTNAFYLFTVI